MLRTLAQLLLTPLPSCCKVPLYRLLGARTRFAAHIGAFTVLAADAIELGPEARIKPLTLIFGLKRLHMGAYAGISNLCVINGSATFSHGAARVGGARDA